jgi:hypothetical protein
VPEPGLADLAIELAVQIDGTRRPQEHARVVRCRGRRAQLGRRLEREVSADDLDAAQSYGALSRAR